MKDIVLEIGGDGGKISELNACGGEDSGCGNTNKACAGA